MSSPGIEPGLRPSQSRVRIRHTPRTGVRGLCLRRLVIRQLHRMRATQAPANIHQVPRQGIEPRLAVPKTAVPSITLARHQVKSRRRDSHPHDPVYWTGVFLCRATSAFNQATVRGFEPRATVLEAVCSPRSTPLCKAADLNTEAGCSRHSFLAAPPTISPVRHARLIDERRHRAQGRPCLILQFNVPVAFAHETRPAFNPNTASRVQRSPHRAHRH